MSKPNPTNQRQVMRPSSISIKELANMYGMDRKTMGRWLKPHLPRIGKRVGWYYNPRQIDMIFEILGLPNCMDNP